MFRPMPWALKWALKENIMKGCVTPISEIDQFIEGIVPQCSSDPIKQHGSSILDNQAEY